MARPLEMERMSKDTRSLFPERLTVGNQCNLAWRGEDVAREVAPLQLHSEKPHNTLGVMSYDAAQ